MIELMLLDVDGTLTDGRISYDQNLKEFKSFDAKDGLGLWIWLKLGRKIAIISGRNSEITDLRAKELGISLVFTGVRDKGEKTRALKKELGLEKSALACIGDDLNDLAMFEECGLCFAPNDCASGLRGFADVILNNRGGRGAVREMIEFILNEEGREDEILALFQ